MEPLTVTLLVAIAGIIGTLTAAVLGLKSASKNTVRQIQSSTEIAKLQIHAQVTLTEHLRWQNDFRTTMANFNASVYEILMIAAERTANITPETRLVPTELTVHHDRLVLMLHPSKPDEKEIQDLLDELIIGAVDNISAKVFERRRRLIELSQQLLKTRWDEHQALTDPSEHLPTIP